jgi:hypothetical protein
MIRFDIPPCNTRTLTITKHIYEYVEFHDHKLIYAGKQLGIVYPIPEDDTIDPKALGGEDKKYHFEMAYPRNYFRYDFAQIRFNKKQQAWEVKLDQNSIWFSKDDLDRANRLYQLLCVFITTDEPMNPNVVLNLKGNSLTIKNKKNDD